MGVPRLGGNFGRGISKVFPIIAYVFPPARLIGRNFCKSAVSPEEDKTWE